MNDSEPKLDGTQPDHPVGKAMPAAPLPELVFKPDVREVVRVARVRMFTLVAGIVLVGAALALILMYRPPARPSQTTLGRALPPAESTAAVYTPAVTPQLPIRRVAGAVEVARLATATIDTLVSRAVEKWLRATELSPQGVVTRENGEDVAVKLRKAAILADSARHDIVLARQQAEVVFQASREAESGISFRLSVLYAAVDRYVRSMADDAGDRYLFYSKSEVAAKAILLGDEAESEIQQNVAVSYQRRSEERQASIRRLAQQVHEALSNVDNAGR